MKKTQLPLPSKYSLQGQKLKCDIPNPNPRVAINAGDADGDRDRDNDNARALNIFAEKYYKILNTLASQGGHGLNLSNADICSVINKTWDKFLVKQQQQHQYQQDQQHKSHARAIANNNTMKFDHEQQHGHEQPVAPEAWNNKSSNKNRMENDEYENPLRVPRITYQWSISSFQTFILRFLMFLFNIVETIIMIMVLLFGIYLILVLHKPTQSLISRNSQDLIYPFMRGLRLATLPILRKFPSISELYEESCLIPNPEYLSTMVDCWPCETVKNVVNLTSISNFTTIVQNGGLPFVITDPNLVPTNGPEFLQKLHSDHPAFHENLIRLFSNSSYIRNIEDVVGLLNLKDDDIRKQYVQVSWKINRISASRILRKYFPRPKFVPLESEVSLQHFMMLDGHKSLSYLLPTTEFPNVYIAQVSGLRRIILIPTPMCQQKCRTVSTLLQSTDILYYNWMYWRPVSTPLETNEAKQETLSLSYVSSFH